MLLDSLYEMLVAGGWILVPIFLIGALAFYIMLNTVGIIGLDIFRNQMNAPFAWFKKSLTATCPFPYFWWINSGISYKLLSTLLSIRYRNHAFQKSALEIELKKTFQRMNQGLFFVGVLASVAPLLGLLGTVDGMVNTFKTITVYGNSNPVLLADGISEALLTTQSGLLIAFPLLLIKNFIEDRITYIEKQLNKLGLAALAELEKSA